MSFAPSNQGRRELPGSHREPIKGARPLGKVDQQEAVEVSLYLRDPGKAQINAQGQVRRLSREEYASQHSAAPEDVEAVRRFAQEYDLSVVDVDPLSRRVELAGSVASMSEAFGTELQRYELKGETFRGRTGPLQIPSELASVVESVLGLDNRPQAHTRIRARHPHAQGTAFTPTQVAQLYNYPTNVDGQGQCIAIIELGGGYKQTDLKHYFRGLLQSGQMPSVSSVSVDAGRNHATGDPNSADGEVDLDIEIIGAIAPGARIVVYFAPNTDRGFIDAINAAIHDTTNTPSVISISWGGPESSWTGQSMQTMDQAFQAAAALGITVCVAAGDNGSGDGVDDNLAHVDFPASDPFVLACGGTRLNAANNQISSEVVWNDAQDSATGGGISDVFGLPTWQQNVGVPASANSGGRVGRGVPDVAGNADPQTGYQVRVDGQEMVVGGTSAVAPLWSALIALINQRCGRSAGFINPVLYQNYQRLLQNNALHDITQGNIAAYQAGPGWDACSGLGSPDGSKLADALNALLTEPALR